MTESDGLTITRTFAAPRELVFDAWITPEHFATWWGGKSVQVPVDTVAMDVRPGGSWKATMVLPEGGHRIDWIGEYVEVDRPSRLVLTLSDGSPERETLTVDLTEVDGGTQMVFQQRGGHLTAEQYEQTKAGYAEFFAAMADLF